MRRTKRESFDGVITGVGGQGVLLMTQILGNAAVGVGYDAISSEVHGMAQRGGVVTSFVRIGQNIYAPTVDDGCADAIVALEPAETLRVIRYTNPATLVIMNTEPVFPPSISFGLNTYPDLDLIVTECKKVVKNVLTLNALNMAKRAGNVRIQNIVMLGYLVGTGILPFDIETVKKWINKTVRPAYYSMNLRAFDLGYEECKKTKNVRQ